MSKIILLIFAISVVLPSESLSQETCEEKLAIAAEICLQKAEEAYSSVVEDALNEGLDALNATDLYHYRGIEALIRSYDMRIDATVVSLDDLLKRPISADLKERAEAFLSRTKKSTRVLSKYRAGY